VNKMPGRRYRKQDSGLTGLVKYFINRPTQNQMASVQSLTGLPSGRTDELRPRELEELAANVFHRLGYKHVTHSGAHSSTDGGADVWMLNNEGLPEIVQCKQLRNRVDRNEMIYFEKIIRRQHAVKGHFWAPGGFTQPAIDYAKSNNIELYEEPQIRKLVDRIHQFDLAQQKLLETQKQQQAVLAPQPPQQLKVPVRAYPKRYLGMTVTQIVIISVLGLCAIASFLVTFIYLLSIYNH
jgi:hypothetical protein